jgi:hypothetical protein
MIKGDSQHRHLKLRIFYKYNKIQEIITKMKN